MISAIISWIDVGFVPIRIWDVLDWLIVAYLLYRVYKLLKGTIGFNIFLGAIILYGVWFLVQSLEMKLLSLILGTFVSVGVLLLIIIFQPEVRRFLLYVGNTTLQGRSNFLNSILSKNFGESSANKQYLAAMSTAINRMSQSKTGALIVFSNDLNTSELSKTGTSVQGVISAPLLESIFNKLSPLHDGAVIISGNKIEAASCILPVSESQHIPSGLGLRHRAGIGVTEASSVSAFIVSEENGQISFAKGGKLEHNLGQDRLIELLNEELT